MTRKIEGFYATCKARGLTGRQGVIIPAANVAQPDARRRRSSTPCARAASTSGPCDTIDEGIELLTGRAAGRRAAMDRMHTTTVHGLVAMRLQNYAERLHALMDTEAGAGDNRQRALEQAKKAG